MSKKKKKKKEITVPTTWYDGGRSCLELKATTITKQAPATAARRITGILGKTSTVASAKEAISITF
jgi:hypothetical protein